MMRTIRIILSAYLLLTAFTCFGQSDQGKDRILLGEEIMPKDTTRQRRLKNHLIAPKGEWQCGLSVMYADFSTENADYMLLLQGLNANASMLRLAPEASYTFAKNHAVGVRFQYTNINGMLDSATADLLGNLSLDVGGFNAMSRSMSGSIYQRTYVGLDRNGRIGIFWDYVLGLTRSKTRIYSGEESSAYTLNQKIHLGFAPGIVYFPMNNVSIQVNICLADLAYNNIKAFESNQVVGTRHAWKARASLNILDINLGLTIHL